MAGISEAKSKGSSGQRQSSTHFSRLSSLGAASLNHSHPTNSLSKQQQQRRPLSTPQDNHSSALSNGTKASESSGSTSSTLITPSSVTAGSSRPGGVGVGDSSAFTSPRNPANATLLERRAGGGPAGSPGFSLSLYTLREGVGSGDSASSAASPSPRLATSPEAPEANSQNDSRNEHPETADSTANTDSRRCSQGIIRKGSKLSDTIVL